MGKGQGLPCCLTKIYQCVLLSGLLGIPCAIAVSMGHPENFHACIIMNSLLLLLCTSSIFSLCAVTIDRFWAIIHPLSYPAKATHRNALIIIAFSWTLGMYKETSHYILAIIY